MLPKDPMILLSYVNTHLRDDFSSLSAFCEIEDITEDDLCKRLAQIDYFYDSETNQFR